jgi:ABC-type transporter MlaC component
MTRSAMGTHWRGLNTAQRQQIVPLFSNYVMDTYLSRLQTTAVEAAGKGLSDRVTYHASDDAIVHGEVRMPSLPSH